MPLTVPQLRSPRSKAMIVFFNELGKAAFTMTHWDLAAQSSFSADEWREFLTNPAVSQYIRDEINAISEIESRKIIMDVSKNSKSTGTAQTLIALDKIRGGGSQKGGPIFIYTYIPPNAREQHAQNVQQLDVDPFKIKGE